MANCLLFGFESLIGKKITGTMKGSAMGVEIAGDFVGIYHMSSEELPTIVVVRENGYLGFILLTSFVKLG